MEKTVLLSVLNLNPISDYDELFELEKVSFEESKEILKLQIGIYEFNKKLLNKFLLKFNNYVVSGNFKHFSINFKRYCFNKDKNEVLNFLKNYLWLVCRQIDKDVQFEFNDNQVVILPKKENFINYFSTNFLDDFYNSLNQFDLDYKITYDLKNVNKKETSELIFEKEKEINSNKIRIKEEQKYDIKNIEHIKELPSNKKELDETYVNQVLLKGYVYSVSSRRVGKKTLFEIGLTDYEDSIIAKSFVVDSDLEKYCSINIGDKLEICGVLQYDSFSDDVVINLNSFFQKEENEIIVMYQKYVNDWKRTHNEGEPACYDEWYYNEYQLLCEEETTKRVELHAHTSFSTQDGLSSVSDYEKECSKKGIEAIAFVDHENVQAFPEIEKVFKNSSIKPIYGCEMNVLQQKYNKIVYDRNPKTQNGFVAIDIETTGFSNVFDDIIEISAYKIENGEQKEFSKLIKLDDYDKLTPTIVSLTGITKEMLIENGVEIKDALMELIEFIGDNYIVAHNGKFDVNFIERKIEVYLNKKIQYSFIDTLNFSKVMLKEELKRFNLKAVSNKLDVVLEEHHRAIYDAIACQNIFYKLLERVENKEIKFKNVLLNEKNLDFVTVNDRISAFNDYPILLKVNIKSEKNKKIINDLIQKDICSIVKIDENEVKKGFSHNYTIEILDKENLAQVIFTISNSTIKLMSMCNYHKIKKMNELNDLIQDEVLGEKDILHLTILAKNQTGIKNLFKLVSLSNTKYLYKGVPTITWTELNKYHEGLFYGSSCVNGIFKQLYENGKESFIETFNEGIFDYFEINPINCYVGISESPYIEENIKKCLRFIYLFAKKHNINIVSSSDAHYCNKESKEYRDIFIDTPTLGGGVHPLKGKRVASQHLLSSSEMFEEMNSIFEEEVAEEIVYKNPQKILSSIEKVKIIHNNLHTPTDDFMKEKGIPSVIEEFKKIVYQNVKKYEVNGKLPQIIQDRLDKEMNSIINNGFAVIYYIAYLLVKKSNSDGYVVGSRGSVGSSFVATLMGITEVNPLPPHYHCSTCNFSSFKYSPEEKKKYSIFEEEKELQKELDKIDDGFDLKDAVCPCCGKPLKGDGHNIPFETFLGFKGDKVPDIDLNFSGDYQSKAHAFCKEIFGEDHAFRAGTIATVAEKTAYAFTKKYYEKNNIKLRNAEIDRRSKFLNGIKRTTGQHPGGIIIIPSNFDVLDFTPIQFPANKEDSEWLTTHFDFHAIHDNVLKLDILGHDDPTVLKYLMDQVHKNPKEFPFYDIKDIPLNDKKVYELLSPNEKGELNSFGIPEFGTSFVREMLKDTKPKSFAELVKISGLSHGTDVWLNNAQDLVNGKGNVQIPFEKVIGCRDDIMVQLIEYGLDFSKAFEIMEFVRKGNPTKNPSKWQEYREYMIRNNIPNWYIDSCGKIQYMFPKAHATAYVLSALRIAWFKVYKPLYFYASYFSIRADQFELETIIEGPNAIQKRIEEIKNNKEATDLEKNKIPVLEIANECWLKGISIKKTLINTSLSKEFIVDSDKNALICSFVTVDGLGESVGNDIVSIRNQNGPFKNAEDLSVTKLNKTCLKKLIDLESLNF